MTRKPSLPAELAQALAELRRANVDGIRRELTIDATAFIQRLDNGLRQHATGLTEADAARIHATLFRWLLKVTHPKNGPARFTSETVEAVGSVLGRLAEAFEVHPDELKPKDGKAQRSKATKARAAKAKRQVSYERQAIHTLLTWGEKSDSPRVWTSVLRRIDIASSRASDHTVPAALLTDEQSSLLATGLLQAFDLLLEEGKDNSLSSNLAVLRRHAPLLAPVTEGLRRIYSTKAALLPSSSQRWLQETLAIAEVAPRIAYGREADRPELKHAAGLLLFLWDVKSNGPELGETYGRFRRLAENHFGLFLRGESVLHQNVRYDSRLHEIETDDADDSIPETIELFRPWVEYFKPPDSSVVVRGLGRRAGSPRPERGRA